MMKNKDLALAGRSIKQLAFAFLDVTDGMKDHDFFAHMGGTKERADEIAKIRNTWFELLGTEWLKSKQ